MQKKQPASGKTNATVSAKNRKKAPPQHSEDHRVRTGAIRRDQTRKKLLAAAMGVFAEKGADSPQIEDFIAAAGVARGTFYNYFKTTSELLSAVTSDLSDEVFTAIEAVVERIPDPLERMASACLLYMHAGTNVRNLGAFLARTGSRSEALGKLVDVYLPRDLELARKAREVDYPSIRAARDLMVACNNQAIQTVHAGDAGPEHLRHVLLLTLRAIGVPTLRARALCNIPLPALVVPEWLEVRDAGV